MNYKNFNDYELLDQIYSCNEDVNEILIYTTAYNRIKEDS